LISSKVFPSILQFFGRISYLNPDFNLLRRKI